MITFEKFVEEVQTETQQEVTDKLKRVFNKLLDIFKNDDEIIEEGKKDKLKKIEKLKKETIDDTVDILIDFLEKFKYALLNSKEINIDQDILNRVEKEIKKEADKYILQELNIGLFFSNLRKSVNAKDIEEAKEIIEVFFTSYIGSLRKRIKDIYRYYDDIKSFHKEFKKKRREDKKSGVTTIIDFSYDEEIELLQIELNKALEWIVSEKKRVLLIFEGRDAAGKGGIIKTINMYLNPVHSLVRSFRKPTEYEKRNWFHRYLKVLPEPGQITCFDRSWYNRAVVEPTMGFCTKEQYESFMNKVNDVEEELINDGLIIMKFWLSITKETQSARFEERKNSPLKYWKYSENDAKSLEKWEVMDKFKSQMFERTSTDISPWVIVDSNSKKLARVNAIRYILGQLDYPSKNYEVLEKIYPEIIYEV